MLKYRINNRDFWDKKNSINITSFEVMPMFGSISDKKEKLVCYYEDEDVVLSNGTKLLVKTVYTPYIKDDDSGNEKRFEFVDTVTVSGVSAEKESFSVLIDKYYDLSISSVSRQTITSYYGSEAKTEKYIYFYFENSHYYGDPKLILDDNGKYTNTVSFYIDYGDETKIIPFEAEYITNDIVRISNNGFKDLDIELYSLIFGKQEKEDENDTDELDDGEDKVGDSSVFRIYRPRFLYTDYVDFSFYYDKPIHRIQIPFSQNFETNLLQSDAIQTQFVDVETEKAINKITDLEKDVYSPVIMLENGAFDNVYKMVFNLHFREHRGDDWLVLEDSYWNGTYVNSDKKLELMDESTDGTPMGFFSYTDNDWSKSNQSDLLSYLNFNNNDVRYQKNKIKKSFLRLSFYDSTNDSDHNLLGYSTIFLNSGNLFTKYVRHFQEYPYTMMQYKDNGKYESMKYDMTGIRVDREPDVKELGKDDEDLRLSSQFTVQGKYTSENSSEGFYLYLWKDNHSCLPQNIYMKVEFNHAGYGRTIPFMLPYVKKGESKYADGKIIKAEESSVKTFEEIVSDHNDPTYGYGIRKYLRYSYIRLKYMYDKEEDRHVYYVDPDTYGIDSLSKNMTKDNTIIFNLYEAKISNGANTIENETGGNNDDITITYSNLEIVGTLYYESLPYYGGTTSPNTDDIVIKQTEYRSDGSKYVIEYKLTDQEVKSKYTDTKGYVNSVNGEVKYNYENSSTDIVTVDYVTLNITINGKSAKLMAAVEQNAMVINPEDYIFTFEDGSNKQDIPFDENGNDKYEIVVISTLNGENIDYSSDTANYDGWLNINTYPNKLILSVAKNDGNERSKTITLTQDESGKKLTVNISQDATSDVDIFTITPSNLTFEAGGGTMEATINSKISSVDADFTMGEVELDWCTVTLNGNTVTVVAEENPNTTDRETSTITFTQEETGNQVTLTLNQKAKEVEYTFRFADTTDKEYTVWLPYSAGTLTVGLISTDTLGNKPHVNFKLSDDQLFDNNPTTNPVTNSSYNFEFSGHYPSNTSVDNRDVADIVFTQMESLDTLTLHVKQYGDGTVVIPDFDYLVTRYYWTVDDGKDLDSLTVIRGTGLKTSDGSSIDSHKVGYGGNGNMVGYLEHGGDNTASGNESCLITLANICTEENLLTMKQNGVTDFQVEIYTNWYNLRKNGNCQIEFVAYKGGTISRDSDNKYNFVNTGGTEVYNDIFDFNTWASGAEQSSGYENDYTKTGIINYNISSKSITLSKVSGMYGRRNVRGYFYTKTNATGNYDDGYTGIVTKRPTETYYSSSASGYYFSQHRYYTDSDYTNYEFTPMTFLTSNSTASDGTITLRWVENSAEDSRGKKYMENIVIKEATDCTATIIENGVSITNITSINYKVVVSGTVNGDSFDGITIIDESNYTG